MTLRSARKRRARQQAAARAREFDGLAQFGATIREMAEADILASIPESTLAEIRAADEHPLFVALDIAQEGESTGDLVINGRSIGHFKKLWPATAIRDFVGKLKDAAVKGIARLWHGASHDDKREVGRPITAFVREIAGKAHAIAVSWIHDPETKRLFREGKIKTGSMEAEATFDPGSDDSLVVKAIRAVKGIVLAGEGAKPGFAGATVLASVQELVKEEKEMADEVLSLRDVQDLIKDNGWMPAQVFGKETLLEDRVVADAMKAETDSAVEKAVKEKDDEIKKLTPDAEKWQKHTINETTGGLIDKSPLLKDVTKGTAAFVKRALSGRVDLSNVAEAERQAAVDKAVKAQLDFVKDTGITVPEPKAGEGDAGDKGGGGAGDDKGGGGGGGNAPAGGAKLGGPTMFGGKNMQDAKNNPLIPSVDEGGGSK